jgi:hypothetical protein
MGGDARTQSTEPPTCVHARTAARAHTAYKHTQGKSYTPTHTHARTPTHRYTRTRRHKRERERERERERKGGKEEEELNQSSQMRLIRRNINTRIEDSSTNLETVINVPYDHKKVGLPNKSTGERHGGRERVRKLQRMRFPA